MNDEQLDKLFKEQLNNMEHAPDEDIWAKIESDLDKEHKVLPMWKKSWVRYAAAIVAIAFIATWALRNNEEQQISTADTIAVVTEQPVTTEESSEQQQQLEEKVKRPTSPAPVVKAKKKQIASVAEPKKTTSNAINAPQEQEESTNAKETLLTLPDMDLIALKTVHTDSFKNEPLKTHQVVEIDPIQPLIENPEEEETMLAAQPKSTGGLVPTLLNKISDVVNPDDNRTVHFSKDEEGSLRIDIFNTLVKTRTKKRK